MSDHTPHPVRYSDTEAKAILEQALGLDGKEFSRADLVLMARDLGISEERLQSTETAYSVICLVAYLAFISEIYILPAMAIVAFFPLFFMGIYLLFHGVTAIFETTGDDFDKALDDWIEKQATRRQKRLLSSSDTIPPSNPIEG
jgi:hypothetical protein